MKKQIIKISIYGLSVLGLFFQASCKKDYTNPNAAPSDQALNSSQGLTGVAIGLQRIYVAGRASNLYNRITINGLLTKELTVLNQGNTGEYQLQLGGGSVDGTNTLMSGLWTSSNKIIYDANNVITGAQTLGDAGYASGLIAYASIFKALALGDMAMFWEQVPSGIGQNVTFISRTDGFTQAISTIDAALAAVGANAISASFVANIPAGIEIVPTLHALKARFSLFSGNYAQALAEADLSVSPKTSTFNASTVNLNPIFETATSTNNVTAVLDATTLSLPAGLEPDPADQRLPFYTTIAYASKIKGFAATPTSPWPIYLPGEMTLIKAEAYVRQSTPDLGSALTQLNSVITKTAAGDLYGVGANLPAIGGPLTSDELLDEIYKHRSIELFMSGLKLEDMRRFGRPNTERGRNFLPYPFLERDNNPNTPTDPVF